MTPREPRITTLHGDRLVDEYHWLREKDDPEVRAWIDKENARAEEFLAPTKGLQERLYEEMKGRIKETDLSVPYLKGGFWYYSRTEQGKQYPIQCRKRGSLEAEEQVLLDLNELAEGCAFMALGAFDVSDDGRLLAYSTDPTGFRVYRLHVKDLDSGAVLPDTAEDVGSASWAADNRTLFYTTKDSAKRPFRLHRHVLGAGSHDLIYEERDEMHSIYLGRTRSGAYLFLYSTSHTTSEARYLPASEPGGGWKVLLPRKHEREYSVDHHGDRFYIRINDTGRNFRLVSAPVADPSEAYWEQIRPHDDAVMLEDMDFFEGHRILWLREEGLTRLLVTDIVSGGEHSVAFPEPVYSVFPAVNEEWKTAKFRYTYYSMITPRSVYEYDLDSKAADLLKREEVLGGFEPSRYESHRIHATARDGARVPVTLVHRKDFRKDGRASLLLMGYGAYGYSFPIAFNSNRLSLLDRGMAVAIAHVRGGGEMGKKWRDDGRMKKKMNTFTDFIDVAELLIREGYVSPDRLIIEGGSAGGLLVSAVANMRPELWKAVVSQVPFVDVINSMLDESLPLTVAEFEEWGNPKLKEDYEYMRQYCPYTNLGAKHYPAMLVKSSFNDSQVMYWEPAKYVARMQALKTDVNPLLLVTNTGAGHGGASGRYDRLREVALECAFILTQAGTPDPAGAAAEDPAS